jgi:peptidoglycan hydrolase-like protein with peptidoglycan-binding domain
MEVTALPIRKFLAIAAVLMVFSALSPAKTKKHTATHPSSSHSPKPGHTSSKHRHSAKARRGAWKRHGQQGIQSDRIVAIQQALIREKYLDGAPTGKWDDRTQHAMAKYQADHQWQSKVTPDSRALIKLGLGPNHAAEGSTLNLGGSTDAVASTTPASRTATGNPNR